MGYALNPLVEEVGRLNISGNIVNPNWLRHLTTPTGNPSPIAALILSDIVYWYRPTEVRDETTGQFLRFERKFKSDILQRSYDAISTQWGVTKRQAKDACKVLESCGVIRLELRTIATADNRKISNVMFIRLFPDRLAEITFNLDFVGCDISDEGCDEISSQVYRKNGIAGTKNRKTNTKNSTESPPETLLYSNPPNQVKPTCVEEEKAANAVGAMDGKAYRTVEGKGEKSRLKFQAQKLLHQDVSSKNIALAIDQLPVEEVEDALRVMEAKIDTGFPQEKWVGYFVGILKRKIDPTLNEKPKSKPDQKLSKDQLKKMHVARLKMDSYDQNELCAPIRIKKGGQWFEGAFAGIFEDDCNEAYDSISYYLYTEFEGKRYVDSYNSKSDQLCEVEVYLA